MKDMGPHEFFSTDGLNDILDALVTMGLTELQAQAVSLAIAAGQIPHVIISYQGEAE